MKKIILLATLIVSLSPFAQQRPHCLINATTHPDEEPSLEQIESLPRINDLPDERFINSWIWWMEPLNPEWDNYVTLNNMELNPSEPYGTTMEPINSFAYGDHYIYLNANYQEVMLPENGWEILSFNRGWYPDNSSEIDWNENNTLRSIPYLIFYHKLKGTARVFFRYGNNTDPSLSINFASIEIFHENADRSSGVFRLGDGLDRTLDQQTLVDRLVSRVPSPGASELWFSADFQLAYDPCVCHFESDITLRFTFFSEAELELFGRAVTTTDELAPESFMNDPDYIHDFLASADYSLNSMATGHQRNGSIIYKNMQSLLADYEKRLKVYKKKLEEVNQVNSEIDEAEAIIKIAQVVLSMGVTAATGMPEYSSLLSKIPAIKAMKDSPTFGADTQKAFWKALDKTLLTGFELLVKDDLKKKTAPEKPTMPTVSFSEMTFSGNISTETARRTYPLSTPGSNNSNSINVNQPTKYPLYDEALGVFALLERPKFHISTSIKDPFIWAGSTAFWDNLTSENWMNPDYYLDHRYQSWTIENQFKLSEPLKYYYNPALKIVNQYVEASIEVQSTIRPQIPAQQLGRFDCFIDPIRTVNRNSNLIDLKSINGLQTGTKGFNFGANFLCDIDIEGEPLIQGPDFGCSPLSIPVTNFESITTLSLFTPIDAFQNSYSSLGLKNQYFRSYAPATENIHVNPMTTGFIFDHDVYLKLKVDVTFEGTNSEGDPNEYTYLFTYRVLPEDITNLSTDLFPSLPGSDADLTQYPQNLLFDGTVFNGSDVFGCVKTEGQYRCKAWNDIQIAGNIAIDNEFNVIFEAGNEIKLLPTAVVPPNASILIKSPFNFSNPMPPVKPAYVTNFCSGTTALYNANTSLRDYHQEYTASTKVSTDIQHVPPIIFDVSLFPNPTNNDVRASISLSQSATLSISIADLSGKAISHPIKELKAHKGRAELALNTSELSPGLYLVEITMNDEHRIMKLLKQ